MGKVITMKKNKAIQLYSCLQKPLRVERQNEEGKIIVTYPVDTRRVNNCLGAVYRKIKDFIDKEEELQKTINKIGQPYYEKNKEIKIAINELSQIIGEEKKIKKLEKDNQENEKMFQEAIKVEKEEKVKLQEGLDKVDVELTFNEEDFKALNVCCFDYSEEFFKVLINISNNQQVPVMNNELKAYMINLLME